MNNYFHLIFFFFFNDTATTEIYTLSLHDALPIYLFFGFGGGGDSPFLRGANDGVVAVASELDPRAQGAAIRSEEHTSELQSRLHLVCRLLLEKKKTTARTTAKEPSSTPDCPHRPR